jgi:hypothetical protein
MDVKLNDALLPLLLAKLWPSFFLNEFVYTLLTIFNRFNPTKTITDCHCIAQLRSVQFSSLLLTLVMSAVSQALSPVSISRSPLALLSKLSTTQLTN